VKVRARTPAAPGWSWPPRPVYKDPEQPREENTWDPALHEFCCKLAARLATDPEAHAAALEVLREMEAASAQK
jgi:hypothetical protein